ncbi:hypothetical protein ACS0TY_029611 [Phlomoides rotata]
MLLCGGEAAEKWSAGAGEEEKEAKVGVLESPSESDESLYSALPLPKPPADFVLDDQGRVLMTHCYYCEFFFSYIPFRYWLVILFCILFVYNAHRALIDCMFSHVVRQGLTLFPNCGKDCCFLLKALRFHQIVCYSKNVMGLRLILLHLRIAILTMSTEAGLLHSHKLQSILISTNNFPLECVIRRIFQNSRGDECMLLCPVDTPVQFLKSVDVEGWSAVSDEEVEAILPTAAYALAKIHMHLVYSGFCYSARGGFCYTEEDIFEFHIDNGEDVDGLPTEGVVIACFHLVCHWSCRIYQI